MSTRNVAFIVVGLVLLKFYLLGRAAAAPPTPIPHQDALAPLPTDTRTAWAADFISRVGNATPSHEIVGFVWAWQGGENTKAKFNPLATTQSAAGAKCFNYIDGHCGVKDYPDYETGMNATVQTITNGSYPSILAGIQSNNVDLAMNDAELGTWGTGLANVQREYQKWPAQSAISIQSATTMAPSTIRQQLVSRALALQGIPYVRGGRSESGGDCSGTMQYIFKDVAQIDIGANTFEQYPNLEHIDISQVQPGDLIYLQYYDDQHTGMIADVDNDGKWDLINNGGHHDYMHVDYDFLSDPYFNEHIIGFARALP